MDAAHAHVGTAGSCAVGCYARSVCLLIFADRRCAVLRSLMNNELDETAESELRQAWGDRDPDDLYL